jgi:multidrug efflux pump subunit AcrB
VVNDVKQRVAGVGMPLEFHAEVLSGMTQQQGNDRRVAGVSLAVAIGVFLLLQAALGSWRLAAMLFLALPLAGVGGLLAAGITGTAMSMGAIFGFFTVFGIAARNSVVLVRRIQALERGAGVVREVELVLRATRERAGPVLLTAIATTAVMLPFAVLGGGAGSEVVLPLAIVVLGGLVTSTLLTLFLVPALYLAFSPRTDRSVRPVASEDI